MAPASPLLSPPNDFRHDSAAAMSPYATAPSSPRGRAGTSPFAAHAEGSLFLTAPPSPNPFVDVLSSSPSTPRLTTTAAADPFDLFHHFASAPASPRRAAAIYAHFAAEGEDRADDDEEEFQPRGSYATSVPFDWEERPGTPKAGLGGGGATAVWDDDDADFEFGTFAANKSAPAQELLTTADELFDQGRIRPTKPFLRTAEKIRPLKPPPGLLDGGSSVGSSPRSPMTRGGTTRSPRRQNRVGSGFDFDPFAAALLEATKAPSPSPLGNKDANADASGSPPEKPTPRRPAPSSRSAGGWRRWWRLSDLLMFRNSSSDAGRASNKDPVSFFKSSSAPQPDPSVTKTFAQQATATGNKASNNNRRTAAAAADDVAGCARLSPLQRLTKGLGGGYSSWHNHGRGMTTAPGTTTTTKG